MFVDCRRPDPKIGCEPGRWCGRPITCAHVSRLTCGNASPMPLRRENRSGFTGQFLVDKLAVSVDDGHSNGLCSVFWQTGGPGARHMTQIEFPISVAVCAWCEPVRPGASSMQFSHGICLRHLRKLRLELQRPGTTPPSATARPVRRPPRAAEAYLPL